MFHVHRQEITWAGRKLVLETGKVARQAHGAVMATYGDTTVLCTVVAAKSVKEGADFFPLTVHYQEKSFAAGRIPGGFLKREGKASEKETLVSRLIDRPIRPLFPANFYNEVQVICTVLSFDTVNDPDIVAMIGASAALALSGVPFLGPIGAARIGFKDGAYLLNPSVADVKSSDLDLVVAGTEEGVLMVESEAKELSEDIMLGAVAFGHKAFQEVIHMIKNLARDAAKTPWELPVAHPDSEKVKKRLNELARTELTEAYEIHEKTQRYEKVHTTQAQAVEALIEEGYPEMLAREQFGLLQEAIVRTKVLETGRRIDGRDLETIRPIVCETGFLPRTHGSALFTRGETQALVVTTLGTSQDEQFIDGLEGEYKEAFMLHYNFPPYSVGEAGRLGAPGRREVGHGKLAWRALRPLIPTKKEFPYTLRVVSEITESNGSSSMATVCGSSLALMDAGVPLPRPIAGIAMGLIKEGDQFAVLSDILGDEDHLGDMDFKVAGTEQGITALQMDLKITSINTDIMDRALAQAKRGRIHILGEMAKALTSAKTSLSEHAPKMVTMSINKEKIRDLIGPGGKVIREICDTTSTRIDIEEDGTVRITGFETAHLEAAQNRVIAVAGDPEVGKVYRGKVVKTADFGAFVNFMGAKDGLVHISELAPARVAKTTDVVNVGDEVSVLVLGFDDRGKIKLSLKRVDQETGQILEA